MKKIDEFVAGKLIEACGDRVNVSPVVAKDNAKLPLIIYACESFEAVHSKMKLEGYWSAYTIDIYAERHEELNELTDKVINALDGAKDKLVEQCWIESGEINYTDCYIQTLKFKIGHG